MKLKLISMQADKLVEVETIEEFNSFMKELNTNLFSCIYSQIGDSMLLTFDNLYKEDPYLDVEASNYIETLKEEIEAKE